MKITKTMPEEDEKLRSKLVITEGWNITTKWYPLET